MSTIKIDTPLINPEICPRRAQFYFCRYKESADRSDKGIFVVFVTGTEPNSPVFYLGGKDVFGRARTTTEGDWDRYSDFCNQVNVISEVSNITFS
jgi:hypothetical protein